jgi:putative PEP-CTERM system TPR-repeat lipoprotein
MSMRSTASYALRRPLAGLSLAICLAFASPIAGAQTTSSRASQFYEDALQRFDKKDFPGTVVQLKNVLRLDSKNLSAQVLLGRALLADGQVNAAEAAFAEAIRLGVNRAEVVVPMAEATILQGNPAAVLNEPRFAVEGLSRDVQFELLIWRAAAATDLTELKSALTAAEAARALRPEDPRSFRAEVPTRIRMNQLKEALAAADRSVALAPRDAESHFVRGEALHVVPDLNKALASYDEALKLDPTHLGALVARAGVHLDFNRYEPAASDVAQALKVAPSEARALYLKAQIALRQGKTAEARAAFAEVTSAIDAVPAQYLRYRPQTQMLGGMAHHVLSQFEKAKPYFEGVLRSQPGNPAAKVLADVYLRERNPDAVVPVLENYLRYAPTDSQAMLLLANAHINAGRAPRAVLLLQEALKGGEQSNLRSTLGLALVGAGRYAEAMRELQAVAAKNPEQLPPALALGNLYLQSGQNAEALKIATKLVKAHPDNPNVLFLLGVAQRQRRDAPGARTALEAALKAQPDLAAARVQLARVDMDTRNYTRAAQTLDTALARNDKDLDALLAVAELTEMTDKLDQAERWYSRADEVAGPNNAGPALALVEFQMRHGQLPKAQEALRRAQSKAPEAVNTLTVAGRVALMAGDLPAARTALTRAATAASFNVPQLTFIAALQLQAGSPQSAAHTLDKALKERPDHVPALALRVEGEIRQSEWAAAEQRIKRIKTLQPRSGLGWALAGDMALARQQPDIALAEHRRAHELDKSTASLVRLFATTMSRDPNAAFRLAEQWLASKPRDAIVLRALADSQLNRGNLAGARRNYEALVRLNIKDADTLNNLAHVLLRQNDAGALKVAEQALAIAPDAAHIIGTTGWAAFKAKQNDRAIQLLRNSRSRAPDNADTRFYLASVLAAMGRNGEARTELTAALAANSGLNHRPEAEQLLTTLR